MRWLAQLQAEQAYADADALDLAEATRTYFDTAQDKPSIESLVARSQQIALASLDGMTVTGGNTRAVDISVLELWKELAGTPRLTLGKGAFRVHTPDQERPAFYERGRTVILFLREPLTRDIHLTLTDPHWGVLDATTENRTAVQNAINKWWKESQ